MDTINAVITLCLFIASTTGSLDSERAVGACQSLLGTEGWFVVASPQRTAAHPVQERIANSAAGFRLRCDPNGSWLLLD
jgi:hypothetical protein